MRRALVGIIAQRLALFTEDMRRAVQAGELRDIGRMAIPDANHNKPAEDLNEDEKSFLRS